MGDGWHGRCSCFVIDPSRITKEAAMTDTYVCWRETSSNGLWSVFRVGGDGRRHQIFSCDRYLDAARLVRELRSAEGQA
jgi:hypothetical protein